MKKLTLAQFKRDAATGYMWLELYERYGKKVENLTKNKVIKIQSNGVVLDRDGYESFLDLPYASLIEYTGSELKVYERGLRELTDLEKQVMDGWHRIEQTAEYQERARIDVLTDGSSTYYQEERYFMNSPCPYLFKEGSLKYDYNTGKIYDYKVKGKCSLKYKVYCKK